MNGFLNALIAVATIWVMASWWIATRGAWLNWPSGRALMFLLGSLALVTANASIAYFVGPGYPAEQLIYSALYAFLLTSVLVVGATILRVQGAARSKRKADTPAEPGHHLKEESHD